MISNTVVVADKLICNDFLWVFKAFIFLPLLFSIQPDTIQPMEKKEKKEVNIDDIKRRLQQIKMGSKT